MLFPQAFKSDLGGDPGSGYLAGKKKSMKVNVR